MKRRIMLVMAVIVFAIGALSLVWDAPVQKTSIPLSAVQTNEARVFPQVAAAGRSQFVEMADKSSGEAIRVAGSQFVEKTDYPDTAALSVIAQTFN